MIGNKIRYRDWQQYSSEYTERIGIVVDAWTEVTGSAKGESFLGFGEMGGNVKSRRMYKVERKLEYSGAIIYNDISHSSLIEVIQRVNEVSTDEIMKFK